MKKSLIMNIIEIAMILNVILLLGSVFVPPTVASDSSIDFSWLPNSESNIAGYKIYYGTTEDVYPNSVDIKNNVPNPTDGRIHGTVPGLMGGTTYYFACKAYNNLDLESDFSNKVEYITMAVPILTTIQFK